MAKLKSKHRKAMECRKKTIDQKKRQLARIAFIKKLTFKSFDDMKPVKSIDPFPNDNFEFILADERHQLAMKRSLIFKKF